jgi:uncharacterized protein YkwD
VRHPALAAAAAVALVPAALPSGAGASPCAGADLDPADAAVAQVRHATICLINGERRARGLVALHHAASLSLAGQRHTHDMVARAYFSHVSPDGTTFVARIRQAGYVRRASNALLGENLAWIGGRPATPRAIVADWMESPPHRATILHVRFRDIGIGVEPRAPRAGVSGGTYAAEFGRRGS